MDFNIEIRKKQLENLDQVINNSRVRVETILKRLEWSKEKVLEEDNLERCPINKNHTISPNCWHKHTEKCRIKKEGYSLDEKFLSEPPENTSSAISIDQQEKLDILRKAMQENPYFRAAWNGKDPDPRTSDRYISTYSVDERLAFYNYSIENTQGPKPPPEFTTVIPKKENDGKLTYEEILAQERDAKRRRAKYKSVHLNKKNDIEIVRELINNQMEEYTEYLKEKLHPKLEPKKEKSESVVKSKESSKKSEESKNPEQIKKTERSRDLDKSDRHRDNDYYKDDYEDNGDPSTPDSERPHSSISRNSTHSGSSHKRHDRYRRRSRDRSRDRSREHSRHKNGSYDSRRWSSHHDRRHRSRSRDSRHSRYYSDRRRH